MTTSFHFFRLRQFPKQDTFETVEQLSLLANTEQNQEVASTKVHLTKGTFLPGAARYLVKHDFLVHLTYLGRARNTTFQEYVTEYDFPMYRAGGSSKGFPCVVIRTKSKVAEDCIKRLNERMEGTFVAESLGVDFEKLRPLVTNIKGAWFGQMQAANITTTGLFGPHVDRSKEFKHAEDIGKLNALMMPYPCKDGTFMVMVTRSGTVVLYDAFDAEEPALEVVLEIREKLLDRAWADPKQEKTKLKTARKRR